MGRLNCLAAILMTLVPALACQPAGAPPSDVAVTHVQGVVMSSGQPLSDARVRIKGHRSSALTGVDGRFRLALPATIQGPRLTASKPGYLIAGVDLGATAPRIDLVELPAEDHENYAWVDPTPDSSDSQRCGNCHGDIYQQWRSGGHATATTNTRFLDLYAGTRSDTGETAGWGLLTEYPAGAGICASCHTPAARLNEIGVGDLREITGVARHGVHCDFCHKVRDIDLPALGLTHGRFAMSLLRPAEGQLFFGPLDDVDRGEDSHLPLQSQSRFCAGCHEGVVFGVPVYTTFSEWQNSPAAKAGKQCQNCHMKPDGDLTNIADGFGGIERDSQSLASHVLLPGGRQQMLRGCVDVAMAYELTGAGAEVRVTTSTHDVGHRVPTGFVDRHLMLVVDGIDAAGQSVKLSAGSRLPSPAGDLATQPGVLFAKLLVDDNGDGPVPFWRTGATPLDTRLHPDAARTDRFVFAGPLSAVRVRLLYRRFWQAVAESKGWPDSTIVVFQRSWNVTDGDAVIDLTKPGA